MRWTSTLHARFVHAVELLGGHESMLHSFLSLLFFCLNFFLTPFLSLMEVNSTRQRRKMKVNFFPFTTGLMILEINLLFTGFHQGLHPNQFLS